MKIAWLCSLLLTVHLSRAFKAAVYEHVQRWSSLKESPSAIIEKNLLKYEEAAHNASLQGADIIVFPEHGILFFGDPSDHAEDIPEPGHVNPCLHTNNSSNLSWPVLSRLSCLARENSIYLVANLIDKKPCVHSGCGAKRGHLYYNTNVAFDREGTLVSRYHKNHLFGEKKFAEPHPPEFAVFETDFGARVGMFICFDVLFKEASELVTKFNIDLAVMSTLWFDELPNWYSVAVQQSWAYHHNVTLLASGVQRPRTGSLGSGIYRGVEGPLIYTYSPDGKDKLLVADMDEPLPRHVRHEGDVIVVRDRVVIEHDTTDFAFVKLEGTSGNETLCRGEYCCSVRFAVPSMDQDFFLLFKIGQKPTTVGVSLGVQECMVVPCQPKDGFPCGRFPYSNGTTFTQLELKANFPTSDVFPLVASAHLALTSTRHWSYNMTPQNETVLTINMPEPLMYAALMGRIYENDFFPPR